MSASLIDPEQHADLIRLQQQAFAAEAALAAHAPGTRGMDLSDEQRIEAAGLRDAFTTATAAVREALYSSGLVETHGYYQPSQDLRTMARQLQQAAG